MGPADNEFVDANGPEELLVEARSLEPFFRGQTRATGTIVRYESVLSQINDFAAFVAVSSGLQPKVTGVVWGSLKIIFMVALNTAQEA